MAKYLSPGHVLLTDHKLEGVEARHYRHRWYTLDRPITQYRRNKAGYMATPVACGWAGAVLEKVISRPFFSDFFDRASRALLAQFYRARRKNSEPGKK